eukprot:jgi/Mesvir1/4169/Mv25675-RA.1
MVDYIMRRAQARFARVEGRPPGIEVTEYASYGGVDPPYRLSDLIYADDTTLVETPESAQLWLDSLSLEARAVGLMISKKTEVMAIGFPAGIAPPTLLLLDGSPVPPATRFKLLGSWLPSTADDINTRIGQAWAALRRLDRFWTCRYLSERRKRILFKALVLSILLYGCEAWTLDQALSQQLDGTVTRMLRHILGVRYQERRTRAELYCELPLVTHTIRHRRLLFAAILPAQTR